MPGLAALDGFRVPLWIVASSPSASATMGTVTEPESLAWFEEWCATAGLDRAAATVSTLGDAMLDAALSGWSDRDLVVLVEAVGTLTGLWRTSEWATLRLGVDA